MQSFKTILCVDGSAIKDSKRPVYCVRPERNPSITRFRHGDGVLAVLDKRQQSELPRPVLITADVPIGLPKEFPEVWKEYDGSFLEWLDARRDVGWDSMIVDSIAQQTAQSPFVVCKKGEKKRDGKFPQRECEKITGGESLFWCVGGKQVGKAALQFWRNVLLPLRTELRNDIAIWPFESHAEKPVVVAECYPAILYSRIWQRRVIKTNPPDVVDALYRRRRRQDISLSQCEDKTWLHAASSEDEFDIFTTALAVAEAIKNQDALLTAPERPERVEGWMLLLAESLSEGAPLF